MTVLRKNLQRAASGRRYREDYAATWSSLATKMAWDCMSRSPSAASNLAAVNSAASERVVRSEPPLNLVAPSP